MHEQFGKPFAMFAVPLGIVMAVVVFLLEFFIPYQDDLEVSIIVGALQIPMVLVLEDTIGGSTSYVTVMSQWVVTPRLQELFPYLAKKRSGVLYVSGAILGALSAAAASCSLAAVQGVGVVEALFGGLLMLLGARLAAGCTSGHGISGMGMLAWLSFLAVPFMFGGAIATAFIMRAADHSLDRFVNTTLAL
nr:hypothetical protein BaRGS_000064 [Batillaria attramentaria]